MRSLAGATFPLFSEYMFAGMGVNWAGTLLGCVAGVLVPIPIIFYVYGHRIRARSAFAPTKPDDEAEASENINAPDGARASAVDLEKMPTGTPRRPGCEV